MRQSGSAIRRELARREDGWSGLTYGDQPQRDAAQRNLAGMAAPSALRLSVPPVYP